MKTRKQKMKTIKKYWFVIAAAIGAIIGFFLLNSTNKPKKIKKIEDEIEDNTKKIIETEKKIEVIKEKTVAAKKEAVKLKNEIAEIEEAKETIEVVEVAIEDAKENILKKTRRKK
jgi:outer membrane murein-binding lipoprotein Lpp